MFKSRRPHCVLWLISVAFAGILAAPAQATAPGVAGDIVFQRYLGPDNSQGSIYTIRPDGTGQRQVTLPAGHDGSVPGLRPA